jgi:hypothetical protein
MGFSYTCTFQFDRVCVCIYKKKKKKKKSCGGACLGRGHIHVGNGVRFLFFPQHNLPCISESIIDRIIFQPSYSGNKQLVICKRTEQILELHCYIVESTLSQRRVRAVVNILAGNGFEVMKPFTSCERHLFDLFLKQVKLVENQQEVLVLKGRMSDYAFKQLLAGHHLVGQDSIKVFRTFIIVSQGNTKYQNISVFKHVQPLAVYS